MRGSRIIDSRMVPDVFDREVERDYEILEPLGRGGMGVVHRARHRRTGDLVALKMVPVDEPELRESLRTEIHALMRIRHPQVVRIRGHGEGPDGPWYAMDLLHGIPLSSLVTVRERDQPLPVGRALIISRRLCDALAHLHGEGLVHRDLKPENVLVTAGDVPVIVDFGLVSHFAARLSREALQREGGSIGSVHTMAPEQIRGESVDARADIYALGCILFELLTGRPPFVGSNAAAVIRGHLRGDPPAPSASNDAVSTHLDALCRDLLAKDPQRRPGHADDVGRILERLGGGPPLAAELRPRPYLYRASLRGRGSLMAKLESAMGDAARERGSMVLIRGESGVGKTRLLLEALRLGERLDFGAVLCETQRDRQVALGALTPLLRHLADRPSQGGAPALDLLTPFLTGAPSRLDYRDADARMAILSALVDATVARARTGRLLLVMDDLQWADELSLSFLRMLVQRLGDLRLLCLAAWRAEEPRPGIDALAASSAVETLEVSRLDASDARAIVTDMMAHPDPPETLLESLVRHSEGNPFFVGEYLRAALDRGTLVRDPQGRWGLSAEATQAFADRSDLGLPASLRELVAVRISGLPLCARRLVRAAAVLGREVQADVLRQVCGLRAEATRTAIAVLTARHALEETRPGVLRFTHDKIREVTYGTVRAARRRDLHRRAATCLQSRDGAEAQAASIGAHWSSALEPEHARPWYLSAARQEAARYNHDEAERLYERVVNSAAAPNPDTVSAHSELGERVLLPRGRAEEASRHHLIGLKLAERLGFTDGEVEALVGIASTRLALTDGHGAGNAAEAACERLRSDSPSWLRAKALNQLGMTLYAQGALVRARETLLRALEISGDDRFRAGSILSSLATVASDMGDPHEARRTFDQALDLHRAAGDRRAEARSLITLAVVEWESGHLDRAIDLTRESLAIALDTGDRTIECHAQANLAGFMLDRGMLDASEQLLAGASRLAVAIGDRCREAAAWIERCRLELARDDVSKARDAIDRGVAVARDAREHRTLGRGLVLQALVCTMEGTLDGKRHLEEALPLARATGDLIARSNILANLGGIHRFRGDDDQAAILLDEAVELTAQLRGSNRVFVLCQKGFLDLARGRDAEPTIAEATRAGDGPDLASLRQSNAAHRDGRPLFRGQLVDTIAPPLRRALIQGGLLTEGVDGPRGPARGNPPG